MKIRLNENEEVVARVKEGLKRTGGYCPCRLARTEENKCMCEEFRTQIASSDDYSLLRLARNIYDDADVDHLLAFLV